MKKCVILCIASVIICFFTVSLWGMLALRGRQVVKQLVSVGKQASPSTTSKVVLSVPKETRYAIPDLQQDLFSVLKVQIQSQLKEEIAQGKYLRREIMKQWTPDYLSNLDIVSLNDALNMFLSYVEESVKPEKIIEDSANHYEFVNQQLTNMWKVFKAAAQKQGLLFLRYEEALQTLLQKKMEKIKVEVVKKEVEEERSVVVIKCYPKQKKYEDPLLASIPKWIVEDVVGKGAKNFTRGELQKKINIITSDQEERAVLRQKVNKTYFEKMFFGVQREIGLSALQERQIGEFAQVIGTTLSARRATMDQLQEISEYVVAAQNMGYRIKIISDKILEEFFPSIGKGTTKIIDAISGKEMIISPIVVGGNKAAIVVTEDSNTELLQAGEDGDVLAVFRMTSEEITIKKPMIEVFALQGDSLSEFMSTVKFPSDVVLPFDIVATYVSPVQMQAVKGTYARSLVRMADIPLLEAPILEAPTQGAIVPIQPAKLTEITEQVVQLINERPSFVDAPMVQGIMTNFIEEQVPINELVTMVEDVFFESTFTKEQLKNIANIVTQYTDTGNEVLIVDFKIIKKYIPFIDEKSDFSITHKGRSIIGIYVPGLDACICSVFQQGVAGIISPEVKMLPAATIEDQSLRIMWPTAQEKVQKKISAMPSIKVITSYESKLNTFLNNFKTSVQSSGVATPFVFEVARLAPEQLRAIGTAAGQVLLPAPKQIMAIQELPQVVSVEIIPEIIPPVVLEPSAEKIMPPLVSAEKVKTAPKAITTPPLSLLTSVEKVPPVASKPLELVQAPSIKEEPEIEKEMLEKETTKREKIMGGGESQEEKKQEKKKKDSSIPVQELESQSKKQPKFESIIPRKIKQDKKAKSQEVPLSSKFPQWRSQEPVTPRTMPASPARAHYGVEELKEREPSFVADEQESAHEGDDFADQGRVPMEEKKEGGMRERYDEKSRTKLPVRAPSGGEKIEKAAEVKTGGIDRGVGAEAGKMGEKKIAVKEYSKELKKVTWIGLLLALLGTLITIVRYYFWV